MAGPRAGVVSVILVNFNGADDTIDAVDALTQSSWPRERLEVIVVDNGSRGDDVARIRAASAGTQVIEAGENLGFAGGCNRGAGAASGEILAFLNNDAKPDPEWIAAAIAAFEAEPDVDAVASRVLDADGRLVDYIDSALTWFGKGYKPFVGETAGTLGSVPKDVLFGTGSAMFVRAAAFRRLGGFDERFFMFYEDVDLGWRLNLLGRRFRYVPESIAFHRHHGSAGAYASFKEDYLLDRNALFALYKNLEQSRLDDVLPAALALTVRRGVAVGGLDSQELDYRRGADDGLLEQPVSRAALASFYAVDQFVEQLPGLTRDRDRIQSDRVVSDRELWSLFGRVDAIPGDPPAYARGHRNLVDAFPVTTRPTATKVVVVTGDPIGPRVAGPAIRAMAIASALSGANDVVLITTSELEVVEAPYRIEQVRPGSDRVFSRFEKWADVILFQGHALEAFESLRASNKILVVDIYDPMHLEQLEQGRELPLATWELQVADATSSLNAQLARGDFFLCASDRQRQFYLGQLAGLGRLNPATYLEDPDLEKLIAVVPFGLSREAPVHERAAIRGVVDGVGADDRVAIWSGGLYNWFDPETLIRAFALLAERRPEAKLFFQGTRHPNPDVPEMAVVDRSRRLAAELGALDRSVFFNDAWVEYSDRQNYLLEADLGVSTHFQHVETTFSFRTRILDYLWAGLPMVVTAGDSFADLVLERDLGLVVPERDVDALADALESAMFDTVRIEEWIANVARAREDFFWDRTLEPLVRFLEDPRRAADSGTIAPRVRVRASRGLRRDLGLAAHHLRNGGVRVVLRKAMRRLGR